MKKAITILTSTREEVKNKKYEALARVESRAGKQLTDFGKWNNEQDLAFINRCDAKLALNADEIVDCAGEFCRIGETIKIKAYVYEIEIKVTKK